MTVRILFFARYRDLAGRDQLDLELPAGSTVGAAIDRLRAMGEPFTALPERPATAQNRIVVRPEAVLAAGDELALLPPVAGG